MNHFLADDTPALGDDFSTAIEFTLPAPELADLLQSQPPVPPIDYDQMFERCLENVEFAQMLLREFQATAAERIESVIRPIEQSQPTEAAHAAHALKGMAGILGANELLDIAHQIESAGNAADVTRLQQLVAPLRAGLQHCLRYIPQVLERNATGTTRELEQAT